MSSLNTSCQEENLSWQMVKTNILNEDTRRKDKGFLPQLEANVAHQFGRGRSKQRSPHKRDKSHARSKSRGKLSIKSTQHQGIQCNQ